MYWGQSKAEPASTPALVGAQAVRREHSERRGQAPAGGRLFLREQSLQEKEKIRKSRLHVASGCLQLVGR